MARQKKAWIGIGIVLLFAVFVIGIIIGQGQRYALSAEGGTYEELKIFSEVLSLVQKNYVEETENQDLVYGAIRGMLNTLDPHSGFMSPEMYKEIQVDTRGEFGGLGIQIGIRDNRLTVIAPIEGTPAERAGIEAGDIIVRVDDAPTKDMTLMEAVHKMRGPKGSTVNLTIHRAGKAKPLTFKLTREQIKIKSVKSEMLEDQIGYLRITQFQERTAADLEAALKKLRTAKMKSMILDLRNNPGGLLASAVETTELFIPAGKLIVSIRGRGAKKKEDEYRSDYKKPFDQYDMIVLVNGGSASAAEIVSGALQDLGRAVILGTPTFGKGSVQTILKLSDGSGLRLTTARYYTPEGRSIQNIGITPDIILEPVSASDEVRGPRILREKDLEGHLKNEGIPDADKPDEKSKEPVIQRLRGADEEGDIQLEKAIELLKTWTIFRKNKELNISG